ncbi:hypothetical protein QYE76_015592 [Lolium multiflorum]|uniref:F-box domain-containing protein n=1 Tax=Lolium multiflorum TaxID=4521 RepID=A0AAD8U764_LOLMU|nr:hypothetical protein QYE76_015592 [Lolium multiflorum]
MEANGGGGLGDGGNHAPANGVGNGLANHAPANGVGHALANGVGHALANEGGHGLANHALANGGDQVPAMEAGGVVPAAQAVAELHPALYRTFLYLPAQEIFRCRRVCRLWNNVTGSEGFRRDHREHHSRTPMPLFHFQDPDLVRINLRAVDIRDRAPRPLFRFTRPRNHDVFRIHGSCAGILLLSSGDSLYACNPCTRRWARLPPLHVDHDIVGFYVTGVYHGDFRCHVLHHDRKDSDCAYWIFTLATAALPRTCIGRPGADDDGLGLDLALAKGILPSHKIPPVFVANALHWLPQAARDNTNVLTFDTYLRAFAMVPPPTTRSRNNGEDVVPVVGGQLFGIDDERLAMTVICHATARVDVWVRCNVARTWYRRYSIRLPVDVISLNEGYDEHGGGLTAGVFAVHQGRNGLVQCPRVLLQCDALGAVLKRHRRFDDRTFLARHTIEESLLLHPSILPMQDTDAVGGDPPFFQNQ